MKPIQFTLVSLFSLNLLVGCNAESALSSSQPGLMQNSISSMEALPRLQAAKRPLNSLAPTEESYQKIKENDFIKANKKSFSTFSIDVDTASYTNIRRFIEKEGSKPPVDAVRIEEMINYFPYRYPSPEGDTPFSIHTQLTECPWQDGHKLLQVGLKGQPISLEKTPASNFVFLLDVSGSMGNANKLPLLKRSLKLLVDQMREEDFISIVVYAGAAGTVLPPTSGSQKEKILTALEELKSGGSTAGSAGITKAYELAKQHYRKEGHNRVILATDGDFNVGASSPSALDKLIVEKRKEGVFLTVLGFGQGNLKDDRMESLANKGNGNYYYIDSILEARKVLVTEKGSSLLTIAKDVKIQLDFDPKQVDSYRLIGYENRLLSRQDFDDDSKDAGELGAGTTVTALYQIIPSKDATKEHPYAQVKLRYKAPKSNQSQLIEHPMATEIKPWEEASKDFRFAASVANFGMQLRGSQYIGNWDLAQVLKNAQASQGDDFEGYRQGFIQLVQKTQTLD